MLFWIYACNFFFFFFIRNKFIIQNFNNMLNLNKNSYWINLNTVWVYENRVICIFILTRIIVLRLYNFAKRNRTWKMRSLKYIQGVDDYYLDVTNIVLCDCPLSLYTNSVSRSSSATSSWISKTTSNYQWTLGKTREDKMEVSFAFPSLLRARNSRKFTLVTTCHLPRVPQLYSLMYYFLFLCIFIRIAHKSIKNTKKIKYNFSSSLLRV